MPARRRGRKAPPRRRSEPLAWATVPPPPDMSDFDRDPQDELPPDAPLPLLDVGRAVVEVDWTGEQDDWD